MVDPKALQDNREQPPSINPLTVSKLTRRDFMRYAAATGISTGAALSTTWSTKGLSASANDIAYVAIHPGIGIARVGNSRRRDGFYIGPEVTNPLPLEPGAYKDDSGAIKRQAARFRIYAYDHDGNVLREVTADDPDTEIRWRVEVANKKAAWYQFEEALDLENAPDVGLRNANIEGRARAHLEIHPQPREIYGPNQSGAKYRFDDGNIMGQQLYLGELRTDEKGRLLFLGGHGDSASWYAHNPPASFGNNDGWYDDTSDGPVSATVSIGGVLYEADPAWVVTAPPNYGSDLVSVKTMHDVMLDMFINPSGRAFWQTFPDELTFTKHILPILQQYSDAQWVNYGFAVQFGHDGPFDFTRKNYLAKLARLIPLSEQEQNAQTKPEEGIVLRQDLYQEFRRQLFYKFRQPDNDEPVTEQWPWMYGDTVVLGDAPQDRNQYLAMTDTQMRMLELWVEGEYVDDLVLPDDDRTHVNIRELYYHTYPTIEEYPIGEQPGELDRAAMHFCLGGAFHPGCEMTWPMRNRTMYRAPFRIRPRSADNPERFYGSTLTHSIVMSQGGPLYFNGPGDITRWMAVPWQTDTSSCRSGYEPSYDPFLPTFWPARVPNHVLTRDNYDIVMNREQRYSDEERRAAFENRAVWLRGLKGEYLNIVQEMVTNFGALGIVEQRAGPRDDPRFPAVIFVESDVGFDEPELANQHLTVDEDMVAALPLSKQQRARAKRDTTK